MSQSVAPQFYKAAAHIPQLGIRAGQYVAVCPTHVCVFNTIDPKELTPDITALLHPIRPPWAARKTA